MLTCPRCRSQSVRRSVRRNFVEKLWSLSGRYPYRCYDCQTRFFAYHVPHEDRHDTKEGANAGGEMHEKTVRVDEEDD
jgi:hypothetical protein